MPRSACFYCRQDVGRPHGPECVIVVKRVEYRIRATLPDVAPFEGSWTCDEPHFWTAADCEFHKNDSSWCADNITHDRQRGEITWAREDAWTLIARLFAGQPADRCILCPLVRFEFVRVVDETPRHSHD